MTNNSQNDLLHKIFNMQKNLNDYVFKTNKLFDLSGAPLTMQTIFADARNHKKKVNQLPNVWLKRYFEAMAAELKELDEELLWKWWSRDEIDLQNIRVELIDILHFLISAMICAGLTADEIFKVYQQKHTLNKERQDKGYNQTDKTEADNRTIKTT